MKKFITEHSFLIVFISLLLLIPSIIGYQKTKINYDILVYLPEDIETIKGQKILTEEFGIGAFSFVTVDNMSHYDILTLEKKIQKIEGVEQAISIADITDVTIPKEMLPEEIIHKVYQGDQTVILVTFSGSTSEESTMNAVKDLRELVGDVTKVSGMTAMVLDTRDLSAQELFAYIVIAVLLCLIVLIVATDSYLIPIFLLGNIGCAILYNMGTNVFLGEISYITKAITAVLQLGVTMDFSIFLYHKYEQAKEIEQDKKRAMQMAIESTFKSVIGSSLTTIAGFLALCSMDLKLGSDIGIVMAKGVLCGFLSVLTLFPALLLVFDRGIEKTRHKVYIPKFKNIQSFIIQHNGIVIFIFVLLLIPSMVGNHNVQVYYKLDKSLPEDLASSIANSELAKNFHIVSPELILIDKDLKSNDLDELLENLKQQEGIDLVLAPKSALNAIPETMIPEDILKVVENDIYQLIIVNSTYEIASPELEKQIVEIQKIVKKYDKNAIVAGEGPLMNDLTAIADHDFKMVNYASILVIFVLMLCVLKSFSLPFILIFTIEFAIFLNMAIAYYSGVTLPFIASIVVGTIQLGATIDYAILMSTKYLEERMKNSKKEAMKMTLSQTVPSILVSALCFFAATFGVAIYSKIDMIGSICNLLSRGAIISMFVVILLLPALLLLFDHVIMKTTKNMKEAK